MDPALLDTILKVGGQAAVLWVAIFYLARGMKKQYEDRIVALEKSSDECNRDRIELHRRIEEIYQRALDGAKTG